MPKNDLLLRVQARFSFPALLMSFSGLIFLSACGGGSSQNNQPPPPPAAVILAFPSNTGAVDSGNWSNNIWTIHADGSHATQLTDYSGGENAGPQALQPLWSPDGNKMVYLSDGALDGSNTLAQYYYLWTMNADGSNKTPIYTQAPVVYSVVGNAADWSHDGTKLAVSVSSGNELEIAVMNADGSSPKLIASGLSAVWSPDGTKLAYAASTPTSDANIWTMHADGSAQTQLTQFGGYENAEAPVWSPDGKKLAFHLENLSGAGFTVWTMNSDGSNQQSYPGSTLLYNDADMIGRLVNWSPDGTKLAFYSTAALDGNPGDPNVDSLNIWLMNADGTNRHPLTNYTLDVGSIYVFDPVWSPDGSQLAFLSNAALDGSDNVGDNTGWCVWTVKADGSSLTPLPATCTGINWGTKWLQPAWKP